MSNEFDDGENSSFFGGGDKVSFREIIMNHLRRISSLGCVEFSGGYWKTVYSAIGAPPEKIYIPDTGEVYMNAIHCFSIFLYPHYDEEMTTEDEEIKKSLSEINASIKTPKDNEKYYTKRIETYNKLLCSLGCFLKRENYLEAGTMEDF